MKGYTQCFGMVLLLLLGVSLPVLGDAAKTVETFRASFERRLNAELDEHGKKARELRLKYIEGLKKLKGILGREEKLKAAAQVVAEIEAIEDGEEAKEVPEDADYRFKRMRQQWDRELDAILKERGKKIKTTSTLYLKALDIEKRKLTRESKIKDALLFEEEEKRVKELPEVKAAIVSTPEPDKKKALEKFLVGTRWYHTVGRANPSGIIRFLPMGKGDYKEGTISVRWEVTGEDTVSVTAKEWEVPLILKFDADRLTYEGRMKIDRIRRKGQIVRRD